MTWDVASMNFRKNSLQTFLEVDSLAIYSSSVVIEAFRYKILLENTSVAFLIGYYVFCLYDILNYLMPISTS